MPSTRHQARTISIFNEYDHWILHFPFPLFVSITRLSIGPFDKGRTHIGIGLRASIRSRGWSQIHADFVYICIWSHRRQPFLLALIILDRPWKISEPYICASRNIPLMAATFFCLVSLLYWLTDGNVRRPMCRRDRNFSGQNLTSIIFNIFCNITCGKQR